MSKSAKRRQKAENLVAKWARILKATNPGRSTDCLSFGKIFSQDPFDCGSPGCPLCSYGKVFQRKIHRHSARNDERLAMIELHGFSGDVCD